MYVVIYIGCKKNTKNNVLLYIYNNGSFLLFFWSIDNKECALLSLIKILIIS